MHFAAVIGVLRAVFQTNPTYKAKLMPIIEQCRFCDKLHFIQAIYVTFVCARIIRCVPVCHDLAVACQLTVPKIA